MKNIKKLNFIVAAFSATLLLSACGNAKIDAVKNHYADEKRTTTYSQLLDNRQICEKSAWNTEKDQNDRDIVVYSCHLKGSKDAFAEDRKEEAKTSGDKVANEKFPITTDFVETFKWIVNADNEATLLAAEMIVKIKKADGSEGTLSEKPVDYPISDSDDLVELIVKNSEKSKNAKEYFGNVTTVSVMNFFRNLFGE